MNRFLFNKMRLGAVLFWVSMLSSSMILSQDHAFQIDVNKIEDGIYLYRSWFDYQGQKASANGIIADAGDSVIIIDTPWDDDQTIQLLDWIERELKKPVALVVITHAHQDRIGGIDVIYERGLRSVGSHLTEAYAIRRGFKAPSEKFEKEINFTIGSLKAEVFYPGPGHTVDNTVVYLSPSGLLHGGCFLKSAEATSLGNIADADLDSWPESIKRLQERYPNAKTIIPGHGSYNPGAIENTIKLLTKK